MNTVFFNLTMSVFWAVLFVGFYFRERWMSPELLDMVQTERTPIVTWCLFMMLMWNAVRIYARRRFEQPTSMITPTIRSKARSITGVDHKVTDPQFIFDDSTPAPKTPPE